MNLLADASLPGLKEAFPKPFVLSLYHHSEELPQLLPKQDLLLCRSTLKVDQALLKNHKIAYVATASSGIDHLDLPWLNSQKIQVIDAKGSNARAVADYVLACLAVLEQKLGIYGTTAGIIGLGEVGTQVAARLKAAGFRLFSYDPLKALRAHESFHSCALEDLYQADLLCIHAQLHHTSPYPSANLINKELLNQLKPGCIIINASRGGIVNEIELLHSPNPLIYCTDVYSNEPSINKDIIAKAFLCTPHIAGHTLEAKYAAVAMVSKKIHQLLGLPLPHFARAKLPPRIKSQKSWNELVLELYNPLEETFQLKQSINKKEAFINLRKNHQYRHDFNVYFEESTLDLKTQLLLGI